MYRLIRPLLFRLDPETAHALTLYVLRFTGALPPLNWAISQFFNAPEKPVHAFGLTFRNPVGLAAGYDKDGIAVRGLAALGFGHIEIGTVTPRPQEGNPRPRLFRLVEDQAVINRMGFPGEGASKVERRLSSVVRRPSSVVIGVNLGKNKDTLLENAAEDYLSLMRAFAPLADYLAINISSPNTVGLRRLQGRDMLENLLRRIAAERQNPLNPNSYPPNSYPPNPYPPNPYPPNPYPPILVKLAPDLTDDELDDALGVILDTGMDGVITTNTTLGREGLRSKHRGETGGLSGSPLRVRQRGGAARGGEKGRGENPGRQRGRDYVTRRRQTPPGYGSGAGAGLHRPGLRRAGAGAENHTGGLTARILIALAAGQAEVSRGGLGRSRQGGRRVHSSRRFRLCHTECRIAGSGCSHPGGYPGRRRRRNFHPGSSAHHGNNRCCRGDPNVMPSQLKEGMTGLLLKPVMLKREAGKISTLLGSAAEQRWISSTYTISSMRPLSPTPRMTVASSCPSLDQRTPLVANLV